MNSNIYITTSCLKDFLSLFNRNAKLDEIILGDTWHPSSGFVDETILDGKHKISDLLDFDYDFRGLIEFEASLDSMRIRLVHNNDRKLEFAISGNLKDIQRLRDKLIETNAYHPNKFEFSCNLVYK